MKTNVAPSWVHARQPQAIVVCPPNCASADRSVLGGDGGIYQRDSSICRAAIHAGVVNASGRRVHALLPAVIEVLEQLL